MHLASRNFQPLSTLTAEHILFREAQLIIANSVYLEDSKIEVFFVFSFTLLTSCLSKVNTSE